MNIALISANGQITLPVEIRRALRLKQGDKVIFLKKDNGEIVVSNTSLVTIHEEQNDTVYEIPFEDEVPTLPSGQFRGNMPVNPAVYALERFQEAMEGEWEKAGVSSEEDVLLMAAEARKEYMVKYRARNSIT